MSYLNDTIAIRQVNKVTEFLPLWGAAREARKRAQGLRFLDVTETKFPLGLGCASARL